MKRTTYWLALAVTGLTACSNYSTPASYTAPPAPPPAAVLSVGFGIKQLQFTWTTSSGVDSYRLLQNPDGASGFTQVGANFASSTTAAKVDIAVQRLDWAAARYALDACNSVGCTRSIEVGIAAGMLQTIGYFKASNAETGDLFGLSVAVSQDGNTLAVGAPFEDSGAIGINGNQADNSAPQAGAVYVFSRSDGIWTQQAYIKASNGEAGDEFGWDLALSDDGNTLAVGADGEDSAATGINGNQADNSALNAGAAYVFTRSSGGVWSQQTYIKASNAQVTDLFGGGISLSGDGDTLAVGAGKEDSAATGINGNQADNLADGAGAAYVFTRNGGTWTQQAYVKASNTGASDTFGNVLFLSSDGNTLAVGVGNEDSFSTGVNGNGSDNSALESGAVYVFTRSGATWSQQAYVKASNTDAGDLFGVTVALSGDGNTLAVGARAEDSAATGINGTQSDNSALSAGAAYVFVRSSGVWSQQAYIKASNAEAVDQFGCGVALSGDGNTLAVGAFNEDSPAAGVNGNQGNSAPLPFRAGAAYVFSRSGSAWLQQAYVKASNPGLFDVFGASVVLSSDGNTLAVGTQLEDSAATGINGNQADNSAPDAGAVYAY